MNVSYRHKKQKMYVLMYLESRYTVYLSLEGPKGPQDQSQSLKTKINVVEKYVLENVHQFTRQLALSSMCLYV